MSEFYLNIDLENCMKIEVLTLNIDVGRFLENEYK